ncbi:hypothetical protein [Vibrio maritimus]|uniref:hypothetical protein n=1 Tax=Vibrio maritimus TaxID=990268 RepID=UPI00373640FC
MNALFQQPVTYDRQGLMRYHLLTTHTKGVHERREMRTTSSSVTKPTKPRWHNRELREEY